MSLITLLAVPIVLLLLGFRFLVRRQKTTLRKWLAGLLSLLVSLVAGGFLLFPPHRAVATTGEHPVKVTKRYYVRSVADPALATDGTNREIPVTIWFPDGNNAEKTPLAVYSPGSYGVAEANETLFRELASHGYTVVSMDHPYHSFMTRLKNGKSIPVDRQFLSEVMSLQNTEDLNRIFKDFTRWNKLRTDDMSGVLDAVLANSEQHPELTRIAPQRVAVMGHSLGGAAALTLGRTRPDLRAVVALEAPFTGDMQGVQGQRFVFNNQPYPVPILHFYSDAVWPHLPNSVTYEMNGKLLKAADSRFQSVHISDVGHLGLTDMALISPVLTNLFDGNLDKADPQVALKKISEVTLAFLERQLK